MYTTCVRELKGVDLTGSLSAMLYIVTVKGWIRCLKIPASSIKEGCVVKDASRLFLFIYVFHLQIRMDMYFLAWQKARPCLFSTPLILPASANTYKSDLYKATWTHVSRLVVSTGSADSSGHIHNRNHAEDG